MPEHLKNFAVTFWSSGTSFSQLCKYNPQIKQKFKGNNLHRNIDSKVMHEQTLKNTRRTSNLLLRSQLKHNQVALSK